MKFNVQENTPKKMIRHSLNPENFSGATEHSARQKQEKLLHITSDKNNDKEHGIRQAKQYFNLDSTSISK